MGLGGPEAKKIETKRVVASTKGASPVHAPTKRPAKKQKAESGEANAKGAQKTAPNKKGRLIVRNMSFKVRIIVGWEGGGGLRPADHYKAGFLTSRLISPRSTLQLRPGSLWPELCIQR